MNTNEIESRLEAVGEELGFDSRASSVLGWTDARTAAQQDQVGMVCEAQDGSQHSFSFWLDPRKVEV